MPNPWMLGAAAVGAVVAAVIALVGVFVGQWLQTRRESTMRAELWKREDQHRFTEYKRELYSELIGSFDRWLKDLNAWKIDEDANNSRHSINIEQWLNWTNARPDEIEPRRNIDILIGRVRLVSPHIWRVVTDQADNQDVATFELASSGEQEEIEDALRNAVRGLEALAETMRADLTGESQGQSKVERTRLDGRRESTSAQPSQGHAALPKT